MYREHFFQEAARAAVESRPSALAAAIQRRLDATVGTQEDATVGARAEPTVGAQEGTQE